MDSSLSLIYDFLFIRKAEGTNVAWGSIYHDPRYIYGRRTLIFPDIHTPRYERKKENFDVAGGRPSRRNTEANIRLTFIQIAIGRPRVFSRGLTPRTPRVYLCRRPGNTRGRFTNSITRFQHGGKMRRKRCFRAKGSRPWNNISALFWKEKRGWKFFYEFFSWNPGNEFPLSLSFFCNLKILKKKKTKNWRNLQED